MSIFGISSIHRPAASELLEGSVVDWLRAGLLEAGGFLNVSFPASGEGHHTLRPTALPGGTNRSVWQTVRSDWVWESGVARTPPPTRASGVWVNGAFTPFGTGCRPDYPNGRVTFPGPVPSGQAVSGEYAFRTVRVFTPRSAPWFYELQDAGWDAGASQAALTGSGLYHVLSQNRVQPPAVFVQAVPRVRAFAGVELGSRQRHHRQDVVFTVVADNPTDRDRLHDALVGQWEGTVPGTDWGAAAAAGRLPLTPSGDVNPSGLTGPALQNTYPWKPARVAHVESAPGEDRARLFQCVVRWETEVQLP